MNPKQVACYIIRAYIYNQINDYHKAKIDLIKASELLKKDGDMENYNRVQELLKITEEKLEMKFID